MSDLAARLPPLRPSPTCPNDSIVGLAHLWSNEMGRTHENRRLTVERERLDELIEKFENRSGFQMSVAGSGMTDDERDTLACLRRLAVLEEAIGDAAGWIRPLTFEESVQMIEERGLHGAAVQYTVLADAIAAAERRQQQEQK